MKLDNIYDKINELKPRLARIIPYIANEVVDDNQDEVSEYNEYESLKTEIFELSESWIRKIYGSELVTEDNGEKNINHDEIENIFRDSSKLLSNEINFISEDKDIIIEYEDFKNAFLNDFIMREFEEWVNFLFSLSIYNLVRGVCKSDDEFETVYNNVMDSINSRFSVNNIEDVDVDFKINKEKVDEVVRNACQRLGVEAREGRGEENSYLKPIGSSRLAERGELLR